MLARCPANNAKEENVKLIEISFVSWFSSLLGQVQKAAEIINRSQTYSRVGSQTTDTRWQNSKFFAAQIQIPIPNLGLVFFVEMENMDSTKMGADKLAENTPKFICPNCLPKPKILGILMKKSSLGVRSPWIGLRVYEYKVDPNLLT